MKYLLLPFLLLVTVRMAAIEHFQPGLICDEKFWTKTVHNDETTGRYIEIWERNNPDEGIEMERVIVQATPSKKAERTHITKVMKKALYPMHYLPGTRTKVHKQSEKEALFEWWTPVEYHSYARVALSESGFHCISYIYKGERSSEIAEKEAEKWLSDFEMLPLVEE